MIKLLKNRKSKLILLAVLTATLVVLSFYIENHYLFLVLTLIIALDAKNLFSKTFGNIKKLKFVSEVLRGLAVITLYFYSFVLVLFPLYAIKVNRPMTFISLALIVLILEALIIYKNSHKYKNILKKLDKDKLNDELKIGDTVEVKSGEFIPADGIIIEGNTLVDEAFLTGVEGMQEKNFGDEVLGTTKNMKNRIVIKVTQVGENAVINQIKSLVHESGKEKSTLNKKTRKMENTLGILILLFSISTLILWIYLSGSVYTGIYSMCSVLLIVAPENFYNSSNLPAKLGLNKATINGVFYKSNKVIEVLNKVTRIILGKRKVLTYGNPEITNIITKEAFNEKRFLILVGSLESLSTHPTAVAINEYCKKHDLTYKKVHDYKVIEGLGVMGNMDNQEIIVGSDKLMEKSSVQMTEDLLHQAQVMSKNLRTPVFVARNRELIGVIGITDEIKEHAKHGIMDIRKNYKLTLITGENELITKAVSTELNIKTYLAGLDEDEKLQELRRYREENDIVAGVGNGKEDKHFLDQSDAGIAIGTYSEIFEESNDVTLLSDDLRMIKKVMDYPTKIHEKINTNLFFTLMYHALVIPIAAGILIPITGLIMIPAEAVLLMALSYYFITRNTFKMTFAK